MKICNKCNFNNDENATFCSKCGTKLITKQKKDVFNILSIISIVLFIVIILANVIIYPLSLRDDESSGMFWFLGVFLPSIPLFFGSIILSIISIVSYFRNIIKKNQVQTKKTILVVINIVQLILTISFIFSIPKLLVYIDYYNENFENKDNISSNDEDLEDDNIDSENEDNIDNEMTYTAKSGEDFVNYLNNLQNSNYTKLNILYGGVKVVLEKTVFGQNYTLYNRFNETNIEYYKLDNDEYFTNIYKFYSIGEDAFVMITEIGPVGSTSRFLIIVFDEIGNILLTREVITSSIDNVIVSDEYISYSSETKMQERMNLDIMAENDADFCSYLDKNLKDDYVVFGSYKYKYNSKEVILEGKQETTILDYKIKYNCR